MIIAYLISNPQFNIMMKHFISEGGIEADPSKVKAIMQMEPPTKIPGLRRFLGMVNQMGKYLPNLAQTSEPLRDTLSKDTA